MGPRGSRRDEPDARDRQQHLDSRDGGDGASDLSLDPVNLRLQRGDLATCTQEDHAVRRRQRGHTLRGEPASHIGLARENVASSSQHDLGLIDRPPPARGEACAIVH